VPKSIIHFGHDGNWKATTPLTPLNMNHHCSQRGAKYPYDDRDLPLTEERAVVLSVLANLSDRRGLRQQLDQIDEDIRIELVDDLTGLVKGLLNR
jgi:hypothetical protein